GNVLQIQTLKYFLRKTLPDYMVPNAILILDDIPLTPNGKVDRKALPKPVLATEQQNIVAASTKMEATLVNLWCGILGLEQVSVEDNFFDLGGTSLLGLRLIARIQKQLKLDLPAVKLYQYTTVRTMARYLTQCTNSNQRHQRIRKPSQPQQPETDSEAIAIIGMVGRFPGADTVEEFWQNLCAGKDSMTFFQPEELDPSVDPELHQDPNYVRARGILRGAELFDAAFFNISPREAEVMDPQARVFLELSHQALETVGYPAEQFPGAIGLYAGSGHNTYFEHYICGRSQIVNRLGPFQTMLANEKDFVTTRIAYKLNLKGPVLSINTACSTSLVATIQAFEGLMTHQCDLALAGGVSITTPQKTGYLYQEGGMLSPDGKCRPFDAKGQGTLFNDGAALVVLKRLSDAVNDGDRIYAVIRGVGMNNDGSDKVSFTAPSVNGQIEAILQAQEMAGIEPETISYVETHGTATPLGDPIEIEALTQAFRTQTSAQQFCGIGSVKSNVGHLVAAAGVAGLIKTALSLYHRQIPPSLYFETPNPQIDFANSPFYVNTALTDWAESVTPRRAGVSSFGVGGTNAHVILEEAPTSTPQPVVSPRPYHLLLLSAKTETALNQLTANLKTYLQGNSQIDLADVAYTLQQGRQRFNQRRFVVCSNPTDAVQLLDTLDPKFSATRNISRQNPEVAFMFPGQGSQYVNMGRNLYEREPIFRQAVDQCAEILQPILGEDIRALIYPDAEQVEASTALLRQTVYTQPALFTVEYALALLWQSWGIKPTALIGHSIGEFVAACLAGIFSLEDGLKLVAQRGKLMWDLPAGAMLSVRLSAEALEPKLPEGVTIAAVNSRVLCVASGPTELIDALQKQLETEEVVCKRLHTSHAFHSPMMEPILEPFTNLVKAIPLTPPQIPIVSTATGNWLTDEQATDPHYWANHLRRAVQFAQGIKTLWQNPQRVLLEVGPRKTATTLARQQAEDLEQQIAIPSLGSTAENQAEWSAILFAMGQLWQSGVQLDWDSFYLNQPRTRLPLPTYPFQRQRFWIDEPLVDKQSVNEKSISSQYSIHSQEASTMPISETQVRTDSRQNRLIPLITEVLENTSGIAMTGVDEVTTFLELGLDSLSLTQVALALTKKFKVKISFRQLLEDYPNLKTLSEHIDQSFPPEAFPAPTIQAVNGSQPVVESSVTANAPVSQVVNSIATQPENMNGIQSLVAQQLQIMAQQLALLNQSSENINSISTTTQPTQKPEPQTVVNYANGNGSNGNGSNNTTHTTTSRRPAPGVKINKSKSNALT
ncbi:MAG: beta-ketoacyl synthase N-terminal-like domain-containing protein, partial [Cyanobacteriota bacterium]|nr:beta-ketoacyl synthase N-terminal-like domain-containing protein [Cyanobacteriota bacterium]